MIKLIKNDVIFQKKHQVFIPVFTFGFSNKCLFINCFLFWIILTEFFVQNYIGNFEMKRIVIFMKYKFLLSIISFVVSYYSISQNTNLVIQTSLFKPTSELGFMYKPGPIFEIGFGYRSYSGRLYYTGSIGYGFAQPFRKYNPAVGYTDESGGVKVYFGTQTISRLGIYLFSIGVDAFILPTPKKSRSNKSRGFGGFNATIGAEVNAIVLELDESTNIPVVGGSNNTNTNLVYPGFTPKIGGSFQYGTKLDFFYGLGKTMGKSPDGLVGFWRPYLKVAYSF